MKITLNITNNQAEKLKAALIRLEYQQELFIDEEYQDLITQVFEEVKRC